MKKTDVIPGRAYQVQSGDYVLPELIEMVVAETEVAYIEPDDTEYLSDLYTLMKAYVDKLERTFDSLQEMDEASVFNGDDTTWSSWSYLSEDKEDILNYCESFEGETAEEDTHFEFFQASVQAEFLKRPKEYGKYDLDEVCEAVKGSYALHPDPKGGGWFKRVPGGSQAPVRVTTEDPWEQDGSDY
jgi:hypothetical protein